MKQWIIDRLKERSTWMGITSLIAAAGVGLAPDQVEAIVTVGIAIGGAVAMFWPDSPKQ